MGVERINLVPNEVIQKRSIQYQIEQDLLDNLSYAQLGADDKEKVKQVLFEMYAEPVSTPQALSAIEFLLFGLGKHLLSSADTSSMTESQQEEHAVMSAIFSQHPVTFSPNDWYGGYVADKLQKALENREAYKAKKQSILGYF